MQLALEIYKRIIYILAELINKEGKGMSLITDEDLKILEFLKRDLPLVTYVERDSLQHLILVKIGWKEEHTIQVGKTLFVKVRNPKER